MVFVDLSLEFVWMAAADASSRCDAADEATDDVVAVVAGSDSQNQLSSRVLVAVAAAALPVVADACGVLFAEAAWPSVSRDCGENAKHETYRNRKVANDITYFGLRLTTYRKELMMCLKGAILQ